MTMNATDSAFNVFYDLEKYLRETFPLFHEKLELEKVNEHGLLFTWKGSKPDLKPVVSFPCS
jgi:Gly-Xaa carboxypeptidase